MKTLLTITFATMLGSLSAWAQTAAPVLPNGTIGVDPGHPRVNEVDHRLNNEQRRINNGAARGSLNSAQANRLDRGEQHIQKQEARDMAHHNGHLTRVEKRRLNREENHVNRHINHAEGHGKMVAHAHAHHRGGRR